MSNLSKLSNHEDNNKQYGGNPQGNDASAMTVTDPKYNIPQYNEFANNPMIPNEQKRIHGENKQYKENPQGNQVLNLQLYQPKPKPMDTRKPVPNPAVFYPNYLPNPFDPVGYANYMQYSGYNQQPAPIYKDYTINIGGIGGSHISTAMFFEDALPSKNVTGTFKSLGERITMYESIRGNLFTNGDGSDIALENDTYNLLSHIKLMDMNPYNASRFSKNPYKGLPFGFLLYRSCYPMRHDNRILEGVCASNSTGINVRIYRLTEGAYLVNKQDILRVSDHDEWRDMAFYNFVKEEILKKKISPNFPFMYGYNISLGANIKFDELKTLQKQVSDGRLTDTSYFNKSWGSNTDYIDQNVAKKSLDELRRINNRDNNMPSNTVIPLNQTGTNPANIKQVIGVIRDPITGLVVKEVTNIPTVEEKLTMLNRYTGKALVCLTEACNYSIIGWAKNEYRANGNIKTMINTGYHMKPVWESVIFQLLAGLYVMQIKGIVINDFRLDRNVFIKDISTGGPVTNFWKYRIDGIEYYIPNYGYLVIIDTNFRDFDKNCPLEQMTDRNRERKLDGSFISDTKLTQDQCISKTFDMFKKSIDPNIFDQDFVNDNGVPPPEDIMKLLSSMRSLADSSPTKNISYYIRRFMTMFMNNRIGGPLKDTEINNVSKTGVKDFRKGQLAVMKDTDGIDKFVVHVRQNDNISRIITKDQLVSNALFVERDVPTSSLFDYSLLDPVKQTFKMNESNLSDDSLIETYNIE